MLDQEYLKNAAAILNNEKVPGSGDGKPNRFFKPEEGKAYTLRILPDKAGAPMKMFAQHYGIGKIGFVCPKKTFNERCPVCDHIISQWKASSEKVQNAFKSISAKMRWYSVVYVRETQEVAIWSYSPTVGKQLMALFQDPEYDDISDILKGVDIEMKVTKDPKKSFSETNIKPKRHSSPLVGTAKDAKKLDEAAAEEILGKIPEIRESMNILNFKEIEETFLSYSLKTPDSESDKEDKPAASGGGSKNPPAADDDIPF